MPTPSPTIYPTGLTLPEAGRTHAMSRVAVGSLVLGATDRNRSFWNLRSFEGWTGSPGSTLDLVQRARGHGATANEPFLAPRHMTLGGRVTAPTPDALNASLNDLNAAVSLTGFTLGVSENGFIRSACAQRNGEVITTKINDRTAAFSIQIVAKDPRKYGDIVSASTLLPSSSGGATWPVTFPLTFTGVSNSGQIVLTNPGNTPAPVWLRIDGPIPAGGWAVTHIRKQQTLTFATSLALTAGEFVTVDMEAREVLAQGQAPRSGYVSGRGWFTLDPGENTIAFAAQNFSSTAQLTVTTRPAWS